MGCGQDIVQGPEGVQRGQRLDVEHIQRRACQLTFLQGLDQGSLIDNRPPRRIDQQRRGFHPAQCLGVHQASGALAEHQMHRQHIGLFEQLLFADMAHTHLRGPFGGEVLTPGDDAHAKHLPELRDTLADAAQAENRQGLAVQVAAQPLLPYTGTQGIGFRHEVAGGGHDQRPGQFRGCVLVAVGTAHLDAQGGGGFEVEGEIAHATGDQQLEFG